MSLQQFKAAIMFLETWQLRVLFGLFWSKIFTLSPKCERELDNIVNYRYITCSCSPSEAWLCIQLHQFFVRKWFLISCQQIYYILFFRSSKPRPLALFNMLFRTSEDSQFQDFQGIYIFWLSSIHEPMLFVLLLSMLP